MLITALQVQAPPDRILSTDESNNNIYSHNTGTNSWEVISHMPTPRHWCLVTVLPGNKLMVVGGVNNTGYTDEVEIIIT